MSHLHRPRGCRRSSTWRVAALRGGKRVAQHVSTWLGEWRVAATSPSKGMWSCCLPQTGGSFHIVIVCVAAMNSHEKNGFPNNFSCHNREGAVRSATLPSMETVENTCRNDGNTVSNYESTRSHFTQKKLGSAKGLKLTLQPVRHDCSDCYGHEDCIFMLVKARISGRTKMM